ncbi:aromatic ring-hydroxylating oxygenase subunit alpha [Haliea sp. E17]|uniref:aromatic ring-hydroxylating oxygenase subunit alpha n=1 Tax=Haliea sp. E17 TaxID=3401576 RepID=UPI003AB0167B
MSEPKAGSWMDTEPYLAQMDFGGFRREVSTERYRSAQYQVRERQSLWMRVWQIAGRADEIPAAGDWTEYRLFDQSWLLVRGRDGGVRGFVNACRHRGNRLCAGSGHSSLFLCPYHNWSFGLEGQLLAVAKPDFEGSVEDFVGHSEDLGLVEVPVETFAGFIFLNPDPGCEPLSAFLGDAAGALAAYPLDQMIPVGINVRERIECNWKVIMDAFGEGYHTQGVHKELIGVVDLQKERYRHYADHCVSTTPFGQPDFENLDTVVAVEVILNIPTSHFPGMARALPRFSALVDNYRDRQGIPRLPAGVSVKSLLQQAVRATLTEDGVDVSQLTDRQMIDYQFWLFFPNVFIQVCAGEATIIIAEPDPDGDPNRCYWRVMALQCLPQAERAGNRAALEVVVEGEHYPYFLALEQDFQQMAIQQSGLRNEGLQHLVLTRQEPRVSHFHTALDRWVQAEKQ